MNRVLFHRLVRARTLLGLLGVCVVVAVIGGAAAVGGGADEVPADDDVLQSVPPHPPFNPWVDDAGRFHSPVWDDRNLSTEQKVANPVFNPQWEPFAACMEAAGITVRGDTEVLFTQADMDALFERLNIENPDPSANKRMDMGEDRDGVTGAFLSCAVEHLG